MPTLQEIDAQIEELQKQKSELQEAERKKAMVGNAKRAVTLLKLMRECKNEIEEMFPGTFEGGAWDALVPQAWPRDTKFKRIADLSDTEVSNARHAAEEIVGKV